MEKATLICDRCGREAGGNFMSNCGSRGKWVRADIVERFNLSEDAIAIMSHLCPACAEKLKQFLLPLPKEKRAVIPPPKSERSKIRLRSVQLLYNKWGVRMEMISAGYEFSVPISEEYDNRDRAETHLIDTKAFFKSAGIDVEVEE